MVSKILLAPPRPKPNTTNDKAHEIVGIFYGVKKMEPVDYLITKKEVIKQSGLSSTTLWRMIKRGEFPEAKRIGTRVLWLQSDVKHWQKSL